MKVHQYGVLILGIIQVIVIVADNCKKHDVNGCSVPLRLPFFYKRRFTPSCNRHDVCYRCGNGSGLNQRRCDDVFLDNMRAACNYRTGIRRKICRAFAKLYYKVVRRFGHRRYRQPSVWYCHQPWVPSCLP